MDGVNELDENGKISNLLDPNAEKINLWTKVTKLAKPLGRKWHFTLDKKSKTLAYLWKSRIFELIRNGSEYALLDFPCEEEDIGEIESKFSLIPEDAF
ncbi:hypothetical protein Hanom_Chr09g00831971 [Helianthus anomalus]